MATPPKTGASFSSDEAKRLGEAFDLALREASGEEGAYATVPAIELRRQLAGFILAGARLGLDEPHRLAAEALLGLQAMMGHPNFNDRLSSGPALRHVKAVRS